MEAPEIVWINQDRGVWFQDPKQASFSEYVRKDAFIEKACEYFAPHISDNSGGYDRARIIEDFKKHMEK